MKTLQFENILNSYLGHYSKFYHLTIVILGSLLLAASAQITLPMIPVPVTLQSLAILFIGMLFGPCLGSQMVLVYLLEGICGLPVFANFSGGWWVLLGPTGGYLLGFLLSVMLIGYLLQKGFAKNYGTIFLAGLLGDIVLFIPGFLMLTHFIGLPQAYLLGVKAFYLVEIGKLILFTAIMPFCWRFIK